MKSLFRDQVNGFSLADRVTYKYYLGLSPRRTLSRVPTCAARSDTDSPPTGRNALFQAKYDQANDALSYAFEHCHRASQHNKRLILVYLTPVKVHSLHVPGACHCHVLIRSLLHHSSAWVSFLPTPCSKSTICRSLSELRRLSELAISACCKRNSQPTKAFLLVGGFS